MKKIKSADNMKSYDSDSRISKIVKIIEFFHKF